MSIYVFPNPTRDFLQISNDTDQNIHSVIIYDTKGSLQGIPINGPRDFIDLSQLDEGVYFIQIEIGTSKLIKKVVLIK